ncbi:MAG: hypothetical protein INH43_24620 [Acidobacteriaceae bacterium]|nr:hypothetical protein [Acidobacteriaceae bacterium]
MSRKQPPRMQVGIGLLAILIMPAAGHGLGCLEQLVLPRYPPLMRGARISAEINCAAHIIKDEAEPKFRCTANSTAKHSLPMVSRLAQSVEQEAKVATDCPLSQAKFRLRFVLTSDTKQDWEIYRIDKEGVVISIGPMEVME